MQQEKILSNLRFFLLVNSFRFFFLYKNPSLVIFFLIVLLRSYHSKKNFFLIMFELNFNKKKNVEFQLFFSITTVRTLFSFLSDIKDKQKNNNNFSCQDFQFLFLFKIKTILDGKLIANNHDQISQIILR